MLAISNLEDFMDKAKVLDMELNIERQATSGDFIQVFDSEYNFADLRSAILESRVCRDLIVDYTFNHVELEDTIYDDGTKVKVGILCSVGDKGYGTQIKMTVKRIDYYYDGEYRSFLGYEALKEFLEQNPEV